MSAPESQTLLVLVCHTPIASALHAVACHGFGMTLSAVQAIDVQSSARPQTVVAELESLWQAQGRPQQVLILTDLTGATPSNGACAWIAQAPSTRAGVSGVNLPMLLRALSHRQQTAQDLAALLQRSAPDCTCMLAET